MLLLFMTFLFINTEVWQVCSALSPPVLWLAVAFFGALAVGFLLVRLPEEVAAVNDQLGPAVVQRAVVGTPLAAYDDALVDVRARAAHPAAADQPAARPAGQPDLPGAAAGPVGAGCSS